MFIVYVYTHIVYYQLAMLCLDLYVDVCDLLQGLCNYLLMWLHSAEYNHTYYKHNSGHNRKKIIHELDNLKK